MGNRIFYIRLLLVFYSYSIFVKNKGHPFIFFITFVDIV
jgi:hypothetical protein